MTTYVERDVRQLLNVRDLPSFELFVRLCAGNTGQLFNMSRIGADVGIDQKTVRAWLGVLEAAFIAFRVPPHHRNFRKRLVKTPKLHFYDTGLAARLLGIESPAQMATHSMRGSLFENWVIVEILKAKGNRGKDERLAFWRDHVGREIDLLLDRGERVMPVEIKAGGTVASDWITQLDAWCSLAGPAAETPTIVYGGDRREERRTVSIVPWREVPGLARAV